MTISWYSIRIALDNAGVEGITIFNGFFSVDNATNLVISFYETINGSTNFNNNILVPTGTGTRYPANDYKGFHAYEYAATIYDNAYISTWNQFDENGVIITSLSYQPTQLNAILWARNIGDETINNQGIVYSYANKINVLYFILPISNPIPPPISNPFSMRSLFTDNAQVYYKPHSLSTGSGGSGVRNSRKKQRKT